MYALGKVVAGRGLHIFGTAVAIECSSMKYVLTCEHNIVDGENLIILKSCSRSASASLIKVECIYKDTISDLALLRSTTQLLYGIKLCPVERLPRQIDTIGFCKFRMYYYNVKDFNNKEDDILDCCVTDELTCQLVDSTSMKWPIVLNDGCSGSAVVDEDGMLVGIYRAFLRTVYTAADGKKSLQEKLMEEGHDEKRENKLLENIEENENDHVSEALSLSSLSVQHSSYSSTPQYNEQLMLLL